MASPISFLVPCAIIAVVSIPLMLKLVPPNRLYGVRTRKTLADAQVWFRANRFGGSALFLASGASAILFFLRPEYASGRSLAGLAIFLAPLAVALGATLVYIRRIAGPAAHGAERRPPREEGSR